MAAKRKAQTKKGGNKLAEAKEDAENQQNDTEVETPKTSKRKKTSTKVAKVPAKKPRGRKAKKETGDENEEATTKQGTEKTEEDNQEAAKETTDSDTKEPPTKKRRGKSSNETKTKPTSASKKSSTKKEGKRTREDGILGRMMEMLQERGSSSTTLKAITKKYGDEENISKWKPKWQSLIDEGLIEPTNPKQTDSEHYQLTDAGIERAAPEGYKEIMELVKTPAKSTEELHELLPTICSNKKVKAMTEQLLKYGSLSRKDLSALMGTQAKQPPFFYGLKKLMVFGYVEADPKAKGKFRLTDKAFVNPKKDRPKPQDVDTEELAAALEKAYGAATTTAAAKKEKKEAKSKADKKKTTTKKKRKKSDPDDDEAADGKEEETKDDTSEGGKENTGCTEDDQEGSKDESPAEDVGSKMEVEEELDEMKDTAIGGDVNEMEVDQVVLEGEEKAPIEENDNPSENDKVSEEGVGKETDDGNATGMVVADEGKDDDGCKEQSEDQKMSLEGNKQENECEEEDKVDKVVSEDSKEGMDTEESTEGKDEETEEAEAGKIEESGEDTLEVDE